MNKLTLGQIQFIDNYLQKADVIFVDIRAEMTDHIASAVESKMDDESIDFYNAFKNYMVVNKKEILKGNKTSNWFFSTAILKKFFMFLLRPGMLLFAFFNFALTVVLLQKTGMDFINAHNKMIVNILMLVFCIPAGIYTFIAFRKRYYYLEKSSFLFAILYYANLLLLIDNEAVNSYVIACSTYFYFTYIFYFISEVKTFRKLNLLTNEA